MAAKRLSSMSPTSPAPGSPTMWRTSKPLEPPPTDWEPKWKLGSLTPLALACRAGYLDVVSTLVALGEDVNEPSSATGAARHPVMVAARAHQWQVVQVLICSGASVEAAIEAREYARTLWSKDRADALGRIDSALRWKADWDTWPPSAKRRVPRRSSVWEEGCLTH